MSTVTMPLKQAIEAMTAVLPHSSKDDVTPAIVGVMIDKAGLIATDRYSVASYPVARKGSGEFLIPWAAADWVTKLKPKTLLNSDLSAYSISFKKFELDRQRAKIRLRVLDGAVVERQQDFSGWVAAFPPVRTLLEKFEPGETGRVTVGGTQMAKLERYARLARTNVLLEFGKAEHSSKPAPLRFTVGDLSGLIQPAFDSSRR